MYIILVLGPIKYVNNAYFGLFGSPGIYESHKLANSHRGALIFSAHGLYLDAWTLRALIEADHGWLPARSS